MPRKVTSIVSWQTGPRGGRFYVNEKGRKVYTSASKAGGTETKPRAGKSKELKDYEIKHKEAQAATKAASKRGATWQQHNEAAEKHQLAAGYAHRAGKLDEAEKHGALALAHLDKVTALRTPVAKANKPKKTKEQKEYEVHAKMANTWGGSANSSGEKEMHSRAAAAHYDAAYYAEKAGKKELAESHRQMSRAHGIKYQEVLDAENRAANLAKDERLALVEKRRKKGTEDVVPLSHIRSDGDYRMFASHVDTAVELGGLGRFLKKSPVHFIESDYQMNLHGHMASNGIYSTRNNEIIMKEGTKLSQFKSIEKEEYSTSGSSPDRIILHELGHHVHASLIKASGASELDTDKLWRSNSESLRVAKSLHNKHGSILANIETEYDKAVADGRVVTSYSRHNHYEWFAEAHSAYCLDNKKFKELFPSAYVVVKDARLALGIEG